MVERSGIRQVVAAAGITVLMGGMSAQHAHAQASGVNLLFEYRGANIREENTRSLDVGYGLSFQHDFKHRIGMGVSGIISGSDDLALEVLYDSKYFMADNAYTSAYVGSFIGYQIVRYASGSKELSRGHVPLGLQFGVRGGLPGYFGEVKIKLGYRLGHGELATMEPSDVRTEPLYWSVGISYLGFGWRHGR